MPGKLCLLVCQNFRPEVSAVLQGEGFADVQVAAFAATCIRPAAGEDQVSRLAAVRAEQGADVVVFGGYCLSRLADVNRTSPAAGSVRMAALARCLEFAASARLVDGQIDAGAYLLTPGWLSHWRRYMGEWGFDQATAREFFAETTRKLVLLDTGTDGDSETHLRELADFLALPYEMLPVELDLLRLHLTRVILEWRVKQHGDVAAVAASGSKSSRHNGKQPAWQTP